MASSPFAPDIPPEPVLPDSGDTSQPGAATDDVSTRRWKLAIAALSALSAFTPVGKGIKGLAALGGITALGGLSDAVNAKTPPKKSAAAATPEPAAAPPSLPDTAVRDEFTANEEALRQQLEPWVKQLQKGGRPAPETQAVVNELNGKLEAIAAARLKKQTDAAAGNERTRKAEADRTKALENEASTNKYRMIGGGLGAITGLGVSALARRNLSKAVKGFEGSAEAIGGRLTDKGTPLLERLGVTSPREVGPGYLKTPGNVMVSKGNVGNDLHSAVNTAYTRGGAPAPLPPLQDLYGAANTPPLTSGRIAGRMRPAEDALNTAKGDFRTRSAEVPPGAPFSADKGERSWSTLGMRGPSTLDKLAKASPVLEKGLPAAYLGDAAVSGALAYNEDDPEMKGLYKRMANAGIFGGLAHMGTRKLGAMATSGLRPSDDAMRKVNSGRERMQNDVQSVGLKDLQDYSKQMNEIGVGGLPKPKQKWIPGDKKMLAKANEAKPIIRSNRADFAANAINNQAIMDAHAKSVVNGKLDHAAFVRELRQAIGNLNTHNGQQLKTDAELAKAIARAFAGGS